MRNEGLQRVKNRNIQYTVRKRKANTIGHMMRRNWLLRHVTEGKIEGRIEATGSRERILKQLLDDINLLVPELFFLILAQPVYKMRIIQEPNKLEL